jgi:hypothetical protein
MRDAERPDSMARRALKEWYSVRPAALREPGLAGQPPAPAHAEPGKRGRLFPGHYYAGGETPGPWRHTAAARSPVRPALAARNVARKQVLAAQRHHNLAPWTSKQPEGLQDPP